MSANFFLFSSLFFFRQSLRILFYFNKICNLTSTNFSARLEYYDAYFYRKKNSIKKKKNTNKNAKEMFKHVKYFIKICIPISAQEINLLLYFKNVIELYQ